MTGERVPTIDETLAERGSRYGDFAEHAAFTQEVKALITRYWHGPDAPHDVREALDMIAHKMGRIVTGDPAWRDSWVDIAGYAELVARRLPEADEPS